MSQIHLGETRRRRDSLARSVAARSHALKLASLFLRTYERSTCSKSSTAQGTNFQPVENSCGIEGVPFTRNHHNHTEI